MTDLPAGRELDQRVAEMIGWRNAGDDPFLQWGFEGPMWTSEPADKHRGWMRLPEFSTDIAAAWQVLDEMVWRVGTANIRLDMEDYGRGAGTSPNGAERAVWVTIGDHTAFGPAPEAICRAALAAHSALTPTEHPHTDPPAIGTEQGG